MDLVSTQKYIIHASQPLSAVNSPPNSLFGSHLHSSHNSFPIIAVAIIGILATALLLVSYYIFVIKCCLNWHRIDILRRFSFSRNRRHEDPLLLYSPAIENRGLDESVIRSLPIIQFKIGEFSECAVCLNEFREEEKLRIIPNCSHVFHIDCIDVWLQTNANCPLCRTSISITTELPKMDRVIAPTSSPQIQNPYLDDFTGRDEDYVVIELSEERLDSRELSVQSISPSPRKLEPKKEQKKGKNFSRVSSMGDECIDIREKDDRFSVQPIRRSFSMDSAADRHLYLAVQEIVQQNRHVIEVSSSEGCSNRVRRSVFSFGYGRGSSVLPINLEP